MSLTISLHESTWEGIGYIPKDPVRPSDMELKHLHALFYGKGNR